MRTVRPDMAAPLKGRPRLKIPLLDILDAVRVHGNQSQAAAAVGCSEGSVRKQIRLAGLDLGQVLAARGIQELIESTNGPSTSPIEIRTLAHITTQRCDSVEPN